MGPKRKLQRQDSASSEEYKRKRLRSIDNKEDEETAENVNLNNTTVYKDIIDHLCSLEDQNEDRKICEMFKKLPSKDEFPIYYDVIEDPVDMKMIRKKTNQYSSLDELESDVRLLIKNAHIFNEPKSQISKDATLLKKAFYAKKAELARNIRKRNNQTAESDEKPEAETASTPTLKRNLAQSNKDDGYIDHSFEANPLSKLYNDVIAHTDQTGRRLSATLLRLPHKRVHQIYYDTIENPFSLCKVRHKIKMNQYHDVVSLEDDFNLVFNNALQYNETGSPNYCDALNLACITQKKIGEVSQSPEYLAFVQKNKSRQKLTKGDLSFDGTPLKKRGRQSKDGTMSLSDSYLDAKVLKQKLTVLFDHVMMYRDADGRYLSEMFMQVPSKADHPEYYDTITTPIDLKMIEDRITAGYYTLEDALMRDLEMMFRNARVYNKADSQIHKDSVMLEKSLKKECHWLNQFAEGSPLKTTRSSWSPSYNQRKQYATGIFYNINQELLCHIRSYTDQHGRLLASIFEKLPSRNDYPDYFQLIKKPIDLRYIGSRVNKYTTIDDLEQDLLLLFSNACHYNEPDSQIYKDSLVLLREMIKKKNLLLADQDSEFPNVAANVQKLLQTLYNNTMFHKDDEGRCYSDSLADILVADSDECSKRKPISLILIGQLLKLGFYKRLDRLQDDMFAVFNHARDTFTTDSEVYEDACELHVFFVNERDQLTKDGLRFMSIAALNFTLKKVQQEIENERKEKLMNESQDENETRKFVQQNETKMPTEVEPDEDSLTYVKSVVVDNITYQVGDYVYVKPEEADCKPHIFSVEKIWCVEDGQQGILGNRYYRPETTFYLASRKFMDQEVFRGQHSSFILFDGVIGRCLVLGVKDYVKYEPEGFSNDDVYVYECRYNSRMKAFRKAKSIPTCANHVTLVARDEPITINRSSSSQQTQEKTKQEAVEELTTAEGYENPLEEHSVIEVSNPVSGCTYYEKYVTCTATYKIGDGVYVKCDEDYLLMSKIDKIWTDEEGIAFFQGFWYVTPEDTKHIPTQLFYKQECFESNVECVTKVTEIAGKCAILNLRDYQLSRPTEIEEKHVYICCAIYIEEEMKLRRKSKGFKRAALVGHVRDDEFWYFSENYAPKKRPSEWLMSLPENADDSAEKEGMKSLVYECEWNDCKYQFEDLHDLMVHVMEGSHFSDGDNHFACMWRECRRTTDQSEVYRTHSRLIRHVREMHLKKSGKEVVDKSRFYFPRHQTCDEKSTDGSESTLSPPASPPSVKAATPPPPSVIATTAAVTSLHRPPIPTQPSQQQVLMQHQVMQQQMAMRGHTLNASQPVLIQSSIPSHVQPQQPAGMPLEQQQMLVEQVQRQQQQIQRLQEQLSKEEEAVFVEPPANTRKLRHSETYLRYIENIRDNKSYLSNWNELAQTSVQTSQQHLPSHWLDNRNGDNVVQALWQLRDHMLRDAVTLSRFV